MDQTMEIVKLLAVMVGMFSSAGIGGWIMSRKLNKATIKKVEAETNKAYSDVYSNLVQDLTAQVELLRKTVDSLSQQNTDLLQEVKTLKTQVKQLVNRLKKYEDVKEIP